MPSKRLILTKLTNLTICLTFLFTQGCSNNSSIFSKDNLPLVHKVDVQQGNVITQDMLAKLKLGMEKKKVRFIMGTPLITDTFHSDRWDYIYTYKSGRQQREQRRVTLFFEDDRLARVDGDVNAANGIIQTDSKHVESVDVPPANPPGLFSRMKEKLTWGSDKPNVEKELSEEAAAAIDPEMESEDAEVSEEDSDLEEAVEDVIDDETESTEESVDEEGNGFFGEMWDEDAETDLEDPVLSDPNLNPSL